RPLFGPLRAAVPAGVERAGEALAAMWAIPRAPAHGAAFEASDQIAGTSIVAAVIDPYRGIDIGRQFAHAAPQVLAAYMRLDAEGLQIILGNFGVDRIGGEINFLRLHRDLAVQQNLNYSPSVPCPG